MLDCVGDALVALGQGVWDSLSSLLVQSGLSNADVFGSGGVPAVLAAVLCFVRVLRRVVALLLALCVAYLVGKACLPIDMADVISNAVQSLGAFSRG